MSEHAGFVFILPRPGDPHRLNPAYWRTALGVPRCEHHHEGERCVQPDNHFGSHVSMVVARDGLLVESITTQEWLPAVHVHRGG